MTKLYDTFITACMCNNEQQDCNDELERIHNEVIMIYWPHYPRTCLKGLRKATESQDIQSLGIDSEQDLLNTKQEDQPLKPWHINFKKNKRMNIINHVACFRYIQYFNIFCWLYKWCLGHTTVWSWVGRQTGNVLSHMVQADWLLDYLIIMHQWLCAGSCEHGNESLGSINYGKFD
jgi:hypothetical protein